MNPTVLLYRPSAAVRTSDCIHTRDQTAHTRTRDLRAAHLSSLYDGSTCNVRTHRRCPYSRLHTHDCTHTRRFCVCVLIISVCVSSIRWLFFLLPCSWKCILKSSKHVCVFIISIDRANRLTNEKTSVLVRLKTQNTPTYHELGPREGAAWGRLNYPSDQKQKQQQQTKTARVYQGYYLVVLEFV